MTGRGRRGLLGGGALFGAALLALCPGVLRGEVLFLRDLAIFHRPLRRVLLDLLARSEGLPAWNPYSHFGQLFAANPNSGVFDPWSALFLVLPFDLAFNLQVLLPLLVGAAGFALLVRTRDGSGFAAAYGALSWGLGGCALSVSGYLQLHHAVALLPVSLALALRLTRSPSARGAAALALALGLQGLAGSPTGLMLTALLLPVAAWEGWSRRPQASGSGAGRALVAAVAIGVAIGAATWLPATALLRESGRVADEGFEEEAGGWSLPPQRLLELAAPRTFGHVVPETVGLYWGRGLYGWRQWPYLFSLYGGLAALALLAPAISSRRSGDRPWMIAGGVGLLLSFGSQLPGWSLLVRVLPPLGVVRFPEKWAVAPALVLALLAASGLDLVLRDARAARRARAVALALAAAFAALTLTFLLGGGASWADLWSIPDWLVATATTLATRDHAWQLLVAAALFGLLSLPRRRAALLPLGLIVLTAVDLIAAGRSLMPTAPAARFDEPPSVLAPLLSAPASERTLFQYADWKHHELRQDGRQVLLEAPVPWQWGIGTAFEKDFDGTQLSWSRSSTRELLLVMAEHPERVAGILQGRGVAAVLRPPVAGEAAGSALLAVPQPRPFVFAAEATVVRRKDEPLGAAVLRAGSAVVLEPGAVAPGRPAPAEVTVLERSPTELRVRSASSGESLLAINGTWHEGWRATVDGQGADLLRRDGHLSALLVPAGEHEVRIRFASPILGAGLALSVLGGLAAALLAFRRGATGERPEAMTS